MQLKCITQIKMNNKQNYKNIGLIGLVFLLFGLIWAAIGELFVDTSQKEDAKEVPVIMKGLSLELSSNSIDSTGSFYEEVLGFKGKIKNYQHGRRLVLTRNDVKIIFYEKSGSVGNGKNSFTINLYMKGIKNFHSQVTEKHPKEIPLQKNDNGELEFQLIDNNGYKLNFIEM